MLERKTVEQILEVLKIVRGHYAAGLSLIKAYQKSVAEVATLYDVRYQTIADGCRRRLGLKDRDQFVELINRWLNGDSTRLIALIKKEADKRVHPTIDTFFGGSETVANQFDLREHVKKIEAKTFGVVRPIGSESAILSCRVDREVAQRIEILSGSCGKSVGEWLSERVRSIVESDYREYIEQTLRNMSSSEKRRFIEFLGREISLPKDDVSYTDR